MTARALVAAAAAQIYPSYSPGGAEYTPNAILIGIHLFLLGLQSWPTDRPVLLLLLLFIMKLVQ